MLAIIIHTYHLNGQFRANPRAQLPAVHRKGKFPCQTLGRIAEQHGAGQGTGRGQVRGGSRRSTSRRYSQDMLVTTCGQDRAEGPRHWTTKLVGIDSVSQNPLSKKGPLNHLPFLSIPHETLWLTWEQLCVCGTFSWDQGSPWTSQGCDRPMWTAETLSRVMEKLEKNVNGMKERALIGDVGVLTSMYAFSFNNRSS